MQHLINHIALVVDASGSMQGLSSKVVEVFDREIQHLKSRSVELDQETRISVYTFSSIVNCIVFDMDVMRMKSLRNHYSASGQTALLDATGKSIEDMEKLPELYGDHAFLVYVLTDGEENCSRTYNTIRISQKLQALKNNWTAVCMVPNARGVHEAKKFGFPAGNIQIWDATSSVGVEAAGKLVGSSLDNYMVMRSKGIRSSSNYFSVDLSGANVWKALEPIKERFSIYQHTGAKAIQIRDFIESCTRSEYQLGNSYYELVKPETIQPQKNILIQDKNTKKVFGGRHARQLLGLPDFETKVKIEDLDKYKVFVQSTSVNRNVIPKQSVLVLE